MEPSDFAVAQIKRTGKKNQIPLEKLDAVFEKSAKNRERCNRSAEEKLQQCYEGLESMAQAEEYLRSVGDLRHQMRFLCFSQETNTDLETAKQHELEKLLAQFRERYPNNSYLPTPADLDDAALEIRIAELENWPETASEKVQKKKRKKKKHIAPQQAGPAPQATPMKKVAAKVDKAALERMQLCAFLNSHLNRDECTLHQRVIRWETTSLNAIRAFEDHGKRLYAQCPIQKLRMHRENHHFPIIAKLMSMEPAQLNKYSYPYTWESQDNGLQQGRVFCVEKIVQGRPTEMGLIHAAVGPDGVVYHCQFTPTKNVKINQLKQMPERPPESVNDGGDAQPFEFKGNCNVDIEEDETLVIQVGNAGDPTPVTFRLFTLN